jgi:hypothetical protein
LKLIVEENLILIEKLIVAEMIVKEINQKNEEGEFMSSLEIYCSEILSRK